MEMRLEICGGKYTFRTVDGDHKIHIDRFSDKDWVLLDEGSKAVCALMGEFIERLERDAKRPPPNEEAIALLGRVLGIGLSPHLLRQDKRISDQQKRLLADLLEEIAPVFDALSSPLPGRGLAFDDPMSHPAVLRMLSERLDQVQDQVEKMPINRLIEVLTKRCRVCGAFGHVDALDMKEIVNGRVVNGVTICPEREKGHEAGGYR